jgi:hypothetical protein
MIPSFVVFGQNKEEVIVQRKLSVKQLHLLLPLRVGFSPTHSCLGILWNLFSLHYKLCNSCELDQYYPSVFSSKTHTAQNHGQTIFVIRILVAEIINIGVMNANSLQRSDSIGYKEYVVFIDSHVPTGYIHDFAQTSFCRKKQYITHVSPFDYRMIANAMNAPATKSTNKIADNSSKNPSSIRDPSNHKNLNPLWGY